MYDWDSVVPAIFVDSQYDDRCFSSLGIRELIYMWGKKTSDLAA